MSTQTENLGLTKPDGDEAYSIEVFNENSDKIDNAINTLNEAVGISEGESSGTGLSAKIGVSTDSTETSVFGKLNIVNNNVISNGNNITNVKTIANSNAEKLTEIDTDIETVNTNVDSAKNAINEVQTGVTAVGNNVNTVKTDIASVQSSVNTANTNISSVKSTGETTVANVSSIKNTVESTDGKADTAVELLNLLKTIATTKTKTVACGKRGTGSTDWETMITITGAGVLDKAIAYSALASWYVRITIDDEIVVNSKGTYQDFIGAINDRIWGNTPGVVLASSDGTGNFATISPKGAWYFGYSGSETKTTGCMCTIPGGIKFQKNFKMEVKGFSDFITVTGEVEENAIVDM